MASNLINLYQHYRPYEREFVDKAYSVVKQVEQTYSIHVTEFLDPRQATIVEQLAAQQGLQCFLSAKKRQLEYGRVIIAPDYYQYDESDFEEILLEISFNRKFNRLTHRQIMGTLMNQLGIRRRVFGDVLVTEEKAQVVVSKSMASYFQQSIERIGKTAVKLLPETWDNLLQIPTDHKQDLVLLSSFRLDKVISEVLHLSRANSAKLVTSKKVKLNYSIVENPALSVELNDLISVRGFGRIRLLEEQGLSKQGKYKVVVTRTTEK